MFKGLWDFIRQGRKDANSKEDSLQRRKQGVDSKLTGGQVGTNKKGRGKKRTQASPSKNIQLTEKLHITFQSKLNVRQLLNLCILYI